MREAPLRSLAVLRRRSRQSSRCRHERLRTADPGSCPHPGGFQALTPDEQREPTTHRDLAILLYRLQQRCRHAAAGVTLAQLDDLRPGMQRIADERRFVEAQLVDAVERLDDL